MAGSGKAPHAAPGPRRHPVRKQDLECPEAEPALATAWLQPTAQSKTPNHRPEHFLMLQGESALPTSR
eukprot:15050434-Alexandrium_andersonii.AAC.1